MTFAHFSISVLMRSANTSGELPIGSHPSAARRSCYLSHGEHPNDLLLQSVDDLPRSSAGSEQTENDFRFLIGRSGLDQGRNIRQRRRTPRAGDHEWPYAALFDVSAGR